MTYQEALLQVMNKLRISGDISLHLPVFNKVARMFWNGIPHPNTLEIFPAFWLRSGVRVYNEPEVLIPTDFQWLTFGKLVSTSTGETYSEEPLDVFRDIRDNRVSAHPNSVSFDRAHNAIAFDFVPGSTDTYFTGEYKIQFLRITAANMATTFQMDRHWEAFTEALDFGFRSEVDQVAALVAQAAFEEGGRDEKSVVEPDLSFSTF